MEKRRVSWAVRFVALAAIALGANAVVQAGPITLEQAATAARRWVQNADFVNGALLGSDVSEVRAVTDPYGDTLFYVAKFDVGGFVIVSPDDRMKPVLAFSEADDLVETHENPLYSLLCADVDSQLTAIEANATAIQKAGGSPQAGSSVATTADLIAEAQGEWDELLDESSGGKAGAGPDGDYTEMQKAGASRPSNVMVEPLVGSNWGQTTSGGSKRVYNAFIPYGSDSNATKWPCGCVATALAQIMRYHRWPTKSLAAKSFNTKKNGSLAPLETKSGTFDWSNMPLMPSASPSSAQINAIAKLTYNVGVASEMNYRRDQSGARMIIAGAALRSYFGYASAQTETGVNLERYYLESIVLANLEYKKPLALGLGVSSDPDSGHCVIADGYGYKGSDVFIHINLGWRENSSDGWYCLPKVREFDVFDSVIYNIFPQESGWIMCGKVTKSGGSVVSGASVSAFNNAGKIVGSAKTNAKGVYALLVPQEGKYTIRAISGDLSGEIEVRAYTTTGAIANKWGQNITVTAAPKTVTVRFDPNGGRGEMKPQTFKYMEFDYLKRCAFEKDGARFVGWKDGDSKLDDGDYVAFMSDTTLYALWEDVETPSEVFTVTFYSNDGRGLNYSQSFKASDSLEACRFSRTGWRFLGWSRTADGDVDFYDEDFIEVTSALNLYAVWERDNSSKVDWTITGDGYLSAVELNGETSVTIPSNVKTIGARAFSGITALEHVTIPESVIKIGMDAFAGCTALKEISIPGGVAEVGGWAFTGCTSLESAIIPGSVGKLGECLFYGCRGLKSVVLGEGISVIPEFMFTGCSSLSSITIPASVGYLYPRAFDGCSALSLVVFQGDAPDAMDDVFADTRADCRLRVRADSTGWPSSDGSLWPDSSDGRPVEILSGFVVSFDWNGWDGAEPLPPIAVPPGTSCDLPGSDYLQTSPRRGYVFQGWSDGWHTYLPASRYTPDANIVLSALWSPVYSTFTFDANGGGPGIQIVPQYFGMKWHGALSSPRREGFAFDGWFTAKKGGTEVDVSGVCDLIGDATFYAHWSKAYSVTVKGGQAQGESDDEPADKTFVATGSGVMVFADDKSDEDLVFSHWSLSPASADLGEFFNPREDMAMFEMPAVNVSLTANYIANPGYVSFLVDIADDTSNPEEDFSNIEDRIEWSTDGKTWATVPSDQDTELPLKAGRSVTLQFRSKDPRWIVPARVAYEIESGVSTSVDLTATRVSIVEVEIDDSEASGTVSVNPKNGQVLPGKPVTITAKPGKNAVFAYWMTSEGDMEYHATAKVSPDCDTVYTAVFRQKDDVESPELDEESFVDSEYAMVGVTFSAGVLIDDDARPAKFSAKGLPPGLKMDAVSGEIVGVPTKAGTYHVGITATGGATGKATSFISKEITIAPLPAWAQGVFAGWLEASGTEDFGVASMTISAAGKISGKYSAYGMNWTFSAASFVSGDEEGLEIEATAKSGKLLDTVYIRLFEEKNEGFTCSAGDGYFDGSYDDNYNGGWIYLTRSLWKDKNVGTAPFVGTYAVSLAPPTPTYEGDETGTGDGADGDEGYNMLDDVGAGYASMTVSAKGTVKMSGKLADGMTISASSDLLWRDGAGWFALFYAAPAAYKGGVVFIPISFTEGDDGAVVVEEFSGYVVYRGDETAGDGYEDSYYLSSCWSNYSPTATDLYEEGWQRYFSITAAPYDKSMSLFDLGFGAAQFATYWPALQFKFKETDFDETNRKATTTWWDQTSSSEPPIAPVFANSAGTGFAVGKATKPVKEDGDWIYEGVNDGALTLSWDRTTGVFKGTYTFWFDYISASDYTAYRDTSVHTSKKVNFEGIIVPGQTLARGFFVWDSIGEYEDEKTEKLKTYNYKQSCGLSLTAQ